MAVRLCVCFFFIDLTQNVSSNRLNTIKFVIYRSELVEIDILLARFRKCQFLHQNVDFLLNAVCSITRSYQLILLIFISKHWTTPDYFVFRFKQNWFKIATERVPQRKNAKWPPWRHRIWTLENRKKWHWQISVKWFVENFIKIGSSVWAVEVTHTDRQTHRHTATHTQTHT